MRLIQLVDDAGEARVGVIDYEGARVRLLQTSRTIYALANAAIAAGRNLEQQAGQEPGDESLDYAGLLREGRVLPPLTHPDPAHCLVTGTGLTHLGSAAARDAMHQKLRTGRGRDAHRFHEDVQVGRGRRQAGATARPGAQPEWFYKGDGGIAGAAPGRRCPRPTSPLDGGEEPELVGLYLIGADGTPHRLGFAIGNEFSDHVTERQNYLYLAHSKLRPCAVGPGAAHRRAAAHLAGTSRIRRGGTVLWEKPFLTGEDNMCHSLANLEYHHFKYAAHRRPGDVHLHFFGTATLELRRRHRACSRATCSRSICRRWVRHCVNPLQTVAPVSPWVAFAPSDHQDNRMSERFQSQMAATRCRRRAADWPWQSLGRYNFEREAGNENRMGAGRRAVVRRGVGDGLFARAGSGGKAQPVLGFSQIGAESEWRTANTESIKSPRAEAGIELRFSDAQQKQENQIKAMRSFIAQSVDVIAFSPVVETGWETVLREAKAAKIPVILTDRAVEVTDDSLYVTFIGSDFVEEGRKAGRWLLRGHARPQAATCNIVELQGTVGSAPAIDRKKGFEEVIAADPRFKIIRSQTGDFTRAKGKEVMEAFLKAEGKKINVLYAHNDDMAIGAIQAIEEAGLKPGKDIMIVSIDGVQRRVRGHDRRQAQRHRRMQSAARPPADRRGHATSSPASRCPSASWWRKACSRRSSGRSELPNRKY